MSRVLRRMGGFPYHSDFGGLGPRKTDCAVRNLLLVVGLVISELIHDEALI